MKDLNKSLELLNEFLSNESEEFLSEFFSEISAYPTANVSVDEYFSLIDQEYHVFLGDSNNHVIEVELPILSIKESTQAINTVGYNFNSFHHQESIFSAIDAVPLPSFSPEEESNSMSVSIKQHTVKENSGIYNLAA